MTDLPARTRFDDLEARLADLAVAVDFPTTPDVAGVVGSRLRSAADHQARPRLLLPRSLRRSLLLAAALALLVVGGALAVRFGLELLSIESGAVPTQSTGAGLGLGRQLALDEVESEAAFDVLVPEALGQPDAVYLGDDELRGQVAFVYAPRDGLPPSSLLDQAGLLVTQNLGRPDNGLAHKIVDTSSATVEPVEVDGAPGVWISGEPHLFWYFAPDGAVIPESRRVVGDTLAWERNGVLYRIEGAITQERALEIARSMR